MDYLIASAEQVNVTFDFLVNLAIGISAVIAYLGKSRLDRNQTFGKLNCTLFIFFFCAIFMCLYNIYMGKINIAEQLRSNAFVLEEIQRYLVSASGWLVCSSIIVIFFIIRGLAFAQQSRNSSPSEESSDI